MRLTILAAKSEDIINDFFRQPFSSHRTKSSRMMQKNRVMSTMMKRSHRNQNPIPENGNYNLINIIGYLEIILLCKAISNYFCVIYYQMLEIKKKIGLI